MAKRITKMSKKRKRFPLEKILSISATEYCQSVDKRLKAYHLQGVTAKTDFDDGDDFKFPKTIIAKYIPKNTEAVVGFQYQFTLNDGNSEYIFVDGTALIPKEKKGKLRK